MFSQSLFWRIAFTIARWGLLLTLVLVFVPVLLLLLVAIFILAPGGGHTWSTFAGHTMANAVTGLWHRFFGPPTVRIHRSHRSRGRRGRRLPWNGG